MSPYTRTPQYSRGGKIFHGVRRSTRPRTTAIRRGRASGTHHQPLRRRGPAADPHPFSVLNVHFQPFGSTQLGGVRLFSEAECLGPNPAPILVLYCNDPSRGQTYRLARYFTPPRDPRLPVGWTEVPADEGFILITGIDLQAAASNPTFNSQDIRQFHQWAEQGHFPNDSGFLVEEVPQWEADSENSSGSDLEQE